MDVHVAGAVTRGLLLRNVDVLTAQLDNAAYPARFRRNGNLGFQPDTSRGLPACRFPDQAETSS
jgi:hypothetical protein